MNTIKQFIILSLALLSSTMVGAQSANRFTFEPIIGTETALVSYPERSYHTRAVYGARVLYGVTLFSGELEYTQAQSSKSLTGNNEVEDKAQRLSAGLRSTFPMGQYIGFHLRAGGRANQGKTTVSGPSGSETKDTPRTIEPYAGAGLQLAFSSNLALSINATLIRNEKSAYDSQYTVGLSTRFGR